MHTSRMNYLGRRLRLSALLLLAGLLSVSCLRLGPKALDLPATPALVDNLGWARVGQAYSRLKALPRFDAADVGHLRDGTILPVAGREFGPAEGGERTVLWFLLEAPEGRGWISSEDVTVFSSREQAAKAAGEGR